MARPRVTMLRRGISLFSILLLCVMGMFPLRLVRCISRLVAPLVYFIPRIRRIGLANLDLAYGDSLAASEKRRILKNAVHNMVRVGCEFPWTGRLHEERYWNQVSFRGMDRLDGSRGAVLMGAHFGNWEWMPSVMARQGYPVSIIVRPLDDPLLDTYIEQTRQRCGVETLIKENAGREAIMRLRKGGIVGIAADQSPRQNGMPVHFFGHPCWGTIGPAMLAMRAQTPIHPVSVVRKPDDTYFLEILPAISLVKTGDMRADLLENTQRCQTALESIVRQYPDHWLWVHRRWKARPGLEREWKRICGRFKKVVSSSTEAEGTATPGDACYFGEDHTIQTDREE